MTVIKVPEIIDPVQTSKELARERNEKMQYVRDVLEHATPQVRSLVANLLDLHEIEPLQLYAAFRTLDSKRILRTEKQIHRSKEELRKLSQPKKK